VDARGRPVPVLVASAMFEGSPDRGVALCIDLTERRRVQRALAERERELRDALAAAEAARAEAEQANQAKSAFLATMSHELRTPLNAIGGYVDLMDLGIRGPVTDAMREDLARIRRSQAHLLGLINDVLNFARLEAGVVRYDLAAVPVREVIAAAEAMVGPQMAARTLAYHPAEADPALLATADADKLRQVLVNLLSNALKFTDAGGSVRTWCEDAGAEVRIHVADTGRGIAPNRLASIFEPFVQVDRDLATRNEGVGLGLAISRELARGMGGDLTAVSEPGQGSTFTLTLLRASD
jgi:signal transduction histidine kinase